jgi:hypothetical protein
VSETAPLDPERLLRALEQRCVRFVLIGALAARLYGFPRLTADADIAPARDDENLERLAAALRDIEAKVYTEGVPEGLAFDCSARTLSRARMWNLVTSAGRVDLAFEPSGTTGHDDLAVRAELFEAFGVQFRVAALDDIIRMKVAAGRPKDREDVLLLRALKARLEKERSR